MPCTVAGEDWAGPAAIAPLRNRLRAPGSRPHLVPHLPRLPPPRHNNCTPTQSSYCILPRIIATHSIPFKPLSCDATPTVVALPFHPVTTAARTLPQRATRALALTRPTISISADAITTGTT